MGRTAAPRKNSRATIAKQTWQIALIVASALVLGSQDAAGMCEILESDGFGVGLIRSNISEETELEYWPVYYKGGKLGPWWWITHAGDVIVNSGMSQDLPSPEFCGPGEQFVQHAVNMVTLKVGRVVGRVGVILAVLQ